MSRLLTHRWLPALAAAAALLLVLPALGVGWQLDDHWQRLILLGKSDPHVPPLQMFSVLRGDPEVNRRYRDVGAAPWWMPDDFKLSFFRPLSTLTHIADYRLWPERPALMHVHSLFWLALLVGAAALLYRSVMGPTIAAGLAALLYAFDDAHAVPAAWIANRNALLAAAFGILAILAHHRWRTGGWRPGAVAGPLLFAVGLASGEGAVAVLAYLAAHALFIDRARPGARMLALLPHAAVFAGYASMYRMLGYGARGSGFYQDPLGDPFGFLRVFAWRAPLYMTGQWTPAPADLGPWLPDAGARIVWIAGMLLVAGLVGLFVPLLRREPAARFWALGSLLSLVPICGTVPSNRLLFFVGLGAMPLVAIFLVDLRARAAWLPRSRSGSVAMTAKAAGVFFVATHLVLSPLAAPVFADSPRRDLGAPVDRAMASVPDDAALAGQDLVVVNAPDYLLFVSEISVDRVLDGGPVPRRIRGLSAGPVPLVVTRPDANTLRLRPGGPFLAGMLGRVYRSGSRPFRAGETVDLDGMRVEVASADADGEPREIAYRFDVALEDASLRWLAWDDGRYVVFRPPAVGETITLPPANGPFERFRISRVTSLGPPQR